MVRTKGKWSVKPVDSALADTLANQMGIASIVAKLLVQRGIQTVEQAHAFLSVTASEQRHDPFFMHGMNDAVQVIQNAIQRKEKIRVFGDYDADGVSATAFAARLLQQCGAIFDTYIPHRQREGYGLNVPAVEQAAEQGVQLLLTVDNGISAVEPIARAIQLGLKVIVTDHHEPPEVLPEATVLINPKLSFCDYPFKGLAGVGVIAKLAEALLGVGTPDGPDQLPDDLAQLIPVGTIADVMPLIGENRRFVKQGLLALKRDPLPGLHALFKLAGIPINQVTSTHFGFVVGPRINASGRLDSAQPSLELLCSENEQTATLWAEQLNELNQKRQRLVEEVNTAALLQVEKKYGNQLPGCIVVADEQWNPGVVGIAAAKLVELTQRPTFVLGIDAQTGIAKGSGRSNGVFDLHHALNHVSDLLEHYGGHHAAAGLSLQAEHVPELARRLSELANEQLSDADFQSTREADLCCVIEDVDVDVIDQLKQLAPFGAGNPAPVFLIPAVQIQGLKTMGKANQHIKLSFKTNHSSKQNDFIDGIAFHKAEWANAYQANSIVNVLVELDVNEWNGQRKPQLLIQDIQSNERIGLDYRGLAKTDKRVEDWLSLYGTDDATCILTFDPYDPLPEKKEQITRLFFAARPRSIEQLRETISHFPNVETWVGWFGENPGLNHLATLPKRERFVRSYQELKQQPRLANQAEAIAAFAKRVGESVTTFQFMLDVFVELGFLEKTPSAYLLAENPPKTPLETSEIYQLRKQEAEMEALLTYENSASFLAWMEAAFSKSAFRINKGD